MAGQAERQSTSLFLKKDRGMECEAQDKSCVKHCFGNVKRLPSVNMKRSLRE